MHVYSDDLKVNYQGYDGMWPVAGRDVVLVTTREKTDTKIYMPAKSCEFGIPEVKGIVRA